MKSMRIIAPAVVAVCLLVTTLALGRGDNLPANTRENAEEQIKTLQTQLVQAVQKGDTSFFEKYYARDCYIIHSDGKLTTKAEEIEDFKSGALKYESIDMRDQKIRTYGDTAVVNSLASIKTTVKGKPVSGDFRAIFVWVRSKGSWKEVAFQTTPVAPVLAVGGRDKNVQPSKVSAVMSKITPIDGDRSASSVRVLVVEDFEPFQRVIRSMLHKRPELQVICEVSDGLDAVRKAEELQPDLILLNIGLPTLNGIEAARRIRRLSPESKILFVSQESSADMVQEALSLGAGYVLKARAGSELLAAVDAVLQGKHLAHYEQKSAHYEVVSTHQMGIK